MITNWKYPLTYTCVLRCAGLCRLRVSAYYSTNHHVWQRTCIPYLL